MFSTNRPFSKWFAKKGDVTSTDHKSTWQPLGIGILQTLHMVFRIPLFARQLFIVNPNIVHFQMNSIWYQASFWEHVCFLYIVLFKKIPISVRFGGSKPVDQNLRRGLIRSMLKTFYFSQIDTLIVQTRALKTHYQEYLHDERIHIVPNGVDTVAFRAPKKRTGSAGSRNDLKIGWKIKQRPATLILMNSWNGL